MDNSETQEDMTTEAPQKPHAVRLDAGMMACPVCGHEMPDLKGGKATICPECGFKDSCCY
jgi:predicted RNA-binding Zn-ribbon protein involved in translation (DUF1610 family)